MGAGNSRAEAGARVIEADQRLIEAVRVANLRRTGAASVANLRRFDVEAKEAALAASSARSASVFSVAWVPLVALGFGAALAVDLYLHESPGHLRRKMMRALRSCRLPPSVRLAASKSPLLPVPGPPLWVHSLPTMIIGPTGCGKSTMLAGLARNLVDAPFPCPSLLCASDFPLHAAATAPLRRPRQSLLMMMPSVCWTLRCCRRAILSASRGVVRSRCACSREGSRSSAAIRK